VSETRTISDSFLLGPISAEKKGELMDMAMTDHGRGASGDPMAAQCFPPGLDDICEFAILRLDVAAASRQAWLSREEARRREKGLLRRLFGDALGETNREAMISVLMILLIIAFTLFLVWGVSEDNSDQSTREPYCE
jgi:hypothetical protein